MDHFSYRNSKLYAEEILVADIVRQWGTPCYIYSRATLERHWNVFDQAFGTHPHRICYAVKANSNLAILNLLARLGSGFDIVSQGELERVLVAGATPEKIIFSGVGKLADEMQRALEVGIGCFNIESWDELLRLAQVAQKLNKKAPISLRVNPDINPKTHPYISTGLKENKFGISIEEALVMYQRALALPSIEIKGISYHIGSQLVEIQPFMDAFDRVYPLIAKLKAQGIHLQHLDIGGGLGVQYTDETPPSPSDYISKLIEKIDDKALEIIIEPGRAVVGNAGILVTKIEYLKKTAHKNFAIVDAAMNDLLRPALYNAYQEIIPLEKHDAPAILMDIVGPVCETADFLGKDRLLAVKEQDFLAVRTAGAYAFTMSSNYNSRPRCCEILVDKDKMYEVRRRESVQDLYHHEQMIPKDP